MPIDKSMAPQRESVLNIYIYIIIILFGLWSWLGIGIWTFYIMSWEVKGKIFNIEMSLT